MSLEPRVRSFLEDMLEYAEHAQRFVEGVSKSAFEEDTEKQFAVIRALEIVGEAAKSIPEEVRIQLAEIPWRQITTMRDKLIHHYFGVEVEILWSTAVEDIPVLIRGLEAFLSAYANLDG